MYCVSLQHVLLHLSENLTVVLSMLSSFRRQLSHISPPDNHRMYNRRRVCVPTLASTNICQMSPRSLQLNQPYYTEVICRKKAGIRLGRYVFQADITTTTGKQPFRQNRQPYGNHRQSSTRGAVDKVSLPSRGRKQGLFDISRL